MLDKISHNDPLWDHPPFAREADLFQLMFRLGETRNGLFLTERSTIFLAQTSPDMPAWIWVADDAPESAYDEVRKVCGVYNISKVTTKPYVADKVFTGHRVIRHLCSYRCDNPVSLPNVQGEYRHPKKEDIPVIAEMMAGFDAHSENRRTTPADYMEKASAQVTNPDCNLWLSKTGDLTAMASIYHRSRDYGRISGVFTLPVHRGNGYAGALVVALCRHILAENRVPVLYTDFEYSPSNRAYQKVGFTPVGQLVTINTGLCP